MRALTSIVIAALLVAGCSISPDTTDTTTPDPPAEVTNDTPTPTPTPTPVPTPEADTMDESATPPATPETEKEDDEPFVVPIGDDSDEAYVSRLVAPADAPDTIAFDPSVLETSEVAVHEFFAALQAGDYLTVYLVLDPGSRRLRSQLDTEEWSSRMAIADHPEAIEAMRQRRDDLRTASSLRSDDFSVFEIMLEEAVIHGALPLDLTQGLYGLTPYEPAEATGRDRHFTARLRATDEPVEVTARVGSDGFWRVRRIGLFDADAQAVPFAGFATGSSSPSDSVNPSRSYDKLATDTPAATLAQIGEFADTSDFERVFLLFDPEARSHAAISTSESPRRLFDAGDAMYDVFGFPGQISRGGPDGFAEALRYGIENHQLGVPLSGYEVLSQADSIDDRGRALAVLEVSHIDDPDGFTITMVEEQQGWRLRQIRRSGAPEARLPFSFDATILIEPSFSLDHDGKIVEIQDLQPLVRATASFLSDSELDTLWADFERSANQPDIAWFANAFVEPGHLVWLDWSDWSGVQPVAKDLAQTMGLEPTFAWDVQQSIVAYDEDPEANPVPIVDGLRQFDLWLGERGYDLVVFEPGWDAYLAVAVPDADAFIALAAEVGVTASSNIRE